MTVHTHNKQAIMDEAHLLCQTNGVRFTQKRQRVFGTLIDLEAPVSAYELADAYQKQYKETMAAMSVYRILDFLMEQHLVHKLSSTNKFVPCSHITCNHSHGTAQFLICDQCHAVTEITLDTSIIQALKNSASSVGFHLNDEQLELNARCNSCQTRES